VLNGFNYQKPQFQVSSAYTKRAMEKYVKIGSMYPVLPYACYLVGLLVYNYVRAA